MFELLFIGLFVCGAIYVIYFLIYSSIKEEKDFALDVYRYLSRRYPKTQIVDYGGISSDPIIQSRDAGPFKLIEIKVVTEKEKDRDLILRGEVDPMKFQRGVKSPNISLHPQFRWEKYASDIEIGIPRLDDRFIISSDDSLFPRQILTRTDLGSLLQKSFDLEGYYIRWLNVKSPVIQVRMETMNSNSFVQAFNILLGTVGALSEKGYLVRNIAKSPEPEVHTLSLTPVVKQKEIQVPQVSTEYYKKPDLSEKKVKTELIDTVDTQEEIISKPKEPDLSWEPVPETSTEIVKPLVEKDQVKAAESPYQSLFSSIRYQAKKIEFEPTHVRILTFSNATQEIVVTFPENKHALFTAFSDRFPLEVFELQIKFQENARPTDWGDPWKDITISGPPEMLEKLQIRTGLAHRISDTGKTMITAKGQPNKGIEYEITVPKTIRGINAGYSLLKDIAWFFEMIFM